jgi:predicted DNA-binding transcriptional regulator YafY
MSKTSSTYRVIEILKELNDGKLLCVENLIYRYDTSERTIRRDFELIREIFGDILLSPRRGCYQIVSKTLLDDTLNSTELYMLKNILKLTQKTNLSLSKDIDDDMKKAILKDESDSPYLFKGKPYEEIYAHKEKFKTLEHAVKFKKEIRFKYTNLDRETYFTLKPYKIVFLNENFYLASQFKTKRKINVTMSRIAMISDIKYTGNTFTYDKDLMEFISFMQSPWATYKSNFKEHLKEVIFTIPKAQAKYFKLKKFLPSQKIIDEDDDGTITLSYTVTSENEVVGLIKQWIPYAKVKAPDSLVGMFKSIAKKYVENLTFSYKK